MTDPSAEVNEADLLEQETPVDDDQVGDDGGSDVSPLEADEGDVLEQRLDVPRGDDDYE